MVKNFLCILLLGGFCSSFKDVNLNNTVFVSLHFSSSLLLKTLNTNINNSRLLGGKS